VVFVVGQDRGRSVVYAPLGLGFRVRVSDRVKVRSIISVSFRVRVRVMVST